ncbi:MAG: GPW/gp25 family protein [Candidatus Zixiibacteriota bacterium]|nr:MAG: GPW/gp25 family protein [candidate division Zixibacteria bacterium]
MDYLSLPMVLREGHLRRASLHDSISYSVALILSTHVGRLPFQPDFGCGIWELEYSDLYTVNKSDVRASLRNAIDKYEKRLYDVSVSFTSINDSSAHILGMVVKVSGLYRDGNEEKNFEASFNLG